MCFGCCSRVPSSFPKRRRRQSSCPTNGRTTALRLNSWPRVRVPPAPRLNFAASGNCGKQLCRPVLQGPGLRKQSLWWRFCTYRKQSLWWRFCRLLGLQRLLLPRWRALRFLQQRFHRAVHGCVLQHIVLPSWQLCGGLQLCLRVLRFWNCGCNWNFRRQQRFSQRGLWLWPLRFSYRQLRLLLWLWPLLPWLRHLFKRLPEILLVAILPCYGRLRFSPCLEHNLLDGVARRISISLTRRRRRRWRLDAELWCHRVWH